MEVRIKDNNGYVDADWTIEDGVMVVSPKVEKFEPKEGDVITCTRSNCTYTFILKYLRGDIAYSYAVLLDNGILRANDWSKYENPHPATEEEKKLLFGKLKEVGYEWDSEKKEVVKIKWKPVLGEIYYRPQLYQGYFEICKDVWNDSTNDEIFYNKCWCFKTGTECQAFCNKLNQSIEGVKP